MIKEKAQKVTTTEHNTGVIKVITDSDTEMIQDYLLHVLLYGSPEERTKILAGVKTLFKLKEKQLIIV